MLAHARDPAQALLAAAAVLKRRQPQRGGELPTRAEVLGLAHPGGQRRCRDDADTGDGREALRQVARPMLGQQLLLRSSSEGRL
jgi:hypothetical protein